jgi:large subunit ribosomal protein L10
MVSELKQKLVQELVEDIKSSPIVGLVNFESLPARQLQNMRAMLLKNGVKMRMARKKLLDLALAESKKKGIDGLRERMKGLPALLFSSENPFTLYAKIQKNKSAAPAKAGQEAPKDIIVKAGSTNFAPGPIISELGEVGIKTKVENGKLAIIADVTVAAEGDEISAKLASMLARLDIQPMEVGLDLVAVLEDGTVFEAKQLRIDEVEYEQNFTQAAQWAMNLAVDAAIAAPDTIEILLQKSFTDARALSVEQEILTDLTAGDILAKVERQALSLKDIAGVETVAKVIEEVKEEASVVEETQSSEATSASATPPEAEESAKEERPAPEPVAEDTESSDSDSSTESAEPKEEKKPTGGPVPEPEAKPAEETPAEEPAEEETKEENEAPVEEEKPEEPQAEPEQAPEESSESEETNDTESTEEKTSAEESTKSGEKEDTQEEEKTEETTEEPETEPVEEEKEEKSPSEEPKGEPEAPVEEPAPESEAPAEEKPEESEQAQEEAPILNEESGESDSEETPTEDTPSANENTQDPIQPSQDEGAQAIIQAMKDKFGEPSEEPRPQAAPTKTVSAENLVEELKQEAHEEQEKNQEEVEKQKSVEEAEDLFNKLMKKGTLRDEQS